MSISSFKKGPNIVTDDFQNAKVLFGNENMLDNKKCFPIYGELDKNQNISNSEDVTSSIDSQQNTDKSTSIQNDDCYNNNEKHSEVIDFVEYEILRSNDISWQGIRQIFRLVCSATSRLFLGILFSCS